MKILVVDDEHILRTRLKSVLEQSGLPLSAVFTAENALNAIECIEKEQPQIVITDIRMPIMSGLELATHIHPVAHATENCHKAEKISNEDQRTDTQCHRCFLCFILILYIFKNQIKDLVHFPFLRCYFRTVSFMSSK